MDTYFISDKEKTKMFKKWAIKKWRLFTLLIAVVLEVSTTATALAGIQNKWGAIGNIVIFIVAGVAAVYIIWSVGFYIVHIINPCRHFGIVSFHSVTLQKKEGIISNTFRKSQELADARIRPYLEKGKKFRCLQVTARNFLNPMQKELELFLAREDTEATIVLCNPKSAFVLDIANVERNCGPSSCGDRDKQILGEINEVVNILDGVIKKVCTHQKHGVLTFGFCDTLFRNGIFTCDDFGWLTINMPPLRTNGCTVSLELTRNADEPDTEKSTRYTEIMEQANWHIDCLVTHLVGENKIIRLNPMAAQFDLFAEIENKYGSILK